MEPRPAGEPAGALSERDTAMHWHDWVPIQFAQRPATRWRRLRVRMARRRARFWLWVHEAPLIPDRFAGIPFRRHWAANRAVARITSAHPLPPEFWTWRRTLRWELIDAVWPTWVTMRDDDEDDA